MSIQDFETRLQSLVMSCVMRPAGWELEAATAISDLITAYVHACIEASHARIEDKP